MVPTVIETCWPEMKEYGFGYGYGYGFGCGQEENSCAYGYGWWYGCYDDEKNKLKGAEDLLICGKDIEEYGFGYGYWYWFGCGEENWDSCTYWFGYGYGCVKNNPKNFNAVAAGWSCGVQPTPTQKFTVTFNPNNGEDSTVKQIESGSGVNALSPEPTRNWYVFKWWYTTSTFDDGTEVEFPYTVTENVTFYAKWDSLCEDWEEYVESESKCYPSWAIIRDSVTNEIIQINDQEWDDLELYFLQSDWTTVKHFTIMDRNLWATEVYNQQFVQDATKINTASFWYHYQRWNNYGFEPCINNPLSSNSCTGFTNNNWFVTTIVQNIWSAYMPSKYARNTWSTSSNWMASSTTSDNIWWWWWDTTSSNADGTLIWDSNNDWSILSWRQWPCPENYYIPSTYDWLTLKKAWWGSVSNSNNWTQFASDLLLPPAGYRDDDKTVYDQGYYGRYWSSSPHPSNANYAHYLSFDSSSISPQSSYYRSYGRSVRCAKSSPNTPTFTLHANGWTKAVVAFTGTVGDGKFTTLWTPTRSNSTFSGWYTASEGWEKLWVWSGVVSDIYARWSCSNGYVDNGTTCVAWVTVTLNATANWGTITPTSVTVANGAQFPLENYIASKDWYTFEWWAETSWTIWVLTSNPTITANKTLYAVYSKTVTATFNKASSVSSISDNSTTCTLRNNDENCTLTAPTINCVAGYDNWEWSPESMTISENTNFTVSCSDTQTPNISIIKQPSVSCVSSDGVRANITDNVWVTSMKYAIIDSSSCNSWTVAKWNDYENESTIPFSSEESNGKYVCFKASDAANNTSYQVTNQITNIDTQWPWVPTLGSPANDIYTNDNTPTFSWSVGEIAWCATLSGYTIQICSDDSCNNVIKFWTPTTTSYTPDSALADGVYYWRVSETDTLNRSGNPTSTRKFTVDTTPPTCSISWNPTNWRQNATLTVTMTDTNLKSDWYSWDGDTYSAIQATSALSNGTYTAYVKDKAWNTNTCNVVVNKIDTTAPNVWIISINSDAEYTNNTTVTLALEASDQWAGMWEMRFSCDNYTWSEWEDYATSKNWTFNSSNGCTSSDGNKTIYVQFQDVLWNGTKTDSDSIKLDTASPSAPTCTVNACYSGSIAIACTSEESPIRYTTDNSDPTCSSTTWTDKSFTSTTTLKVAVCDEAGNLSDINTYTYTVDNSAPSVPTITSEPAYTQWLSNTVISSTVTDNGCNGSVQYQFCYNTANSVENCTTSNWTSSATATFNSLTDWTKYYYFVRSKDELWNTSEWSASTYSTQDATAPVLSGKTIFENVWYTENQISEFTYIDTWAGINWTNKITCEINQEWNASKCTITNVEICDNVWNCNREDQISNTIKLDRTQPVCGTWTYSPTSQTNNNVTATLAGSTDATSWIKTAWWTCTLTSNDTTCNVTIEDNAWLTRVCTSASVNNIDKVKPEGEIQIVTSTLKSTSQTVKLICSDNVWVTSYYWWTNSNPASTDYQNITSQTNYEITKTVNAAWTYYLFCRDEAENISDSKSQVYNSYEVHNMLNKVDKDESTYNAANYTQDGSTVTYIAPAWTTITFANVYTIPTYSSANMYKWYTTVNSWTPSTNSSTTLNSNLTYYFWFDRTKYDLNLVKNNWIETIYYRVNGATSYSNTSDSKSVEIKAWSDVYVYAVAKSWYTYTQTSETNPQLFSSVTDDKTFSPTTSLEEYTITYNNVEWSDNAEKNPITWFTVETPTISLNDITKNRYVFGGWYIDSQFVSWSEISEIAQWTHDNVILYAKWLDDINHNGIDDSTEPRFKVVFSWWEVWVLSGRLEYENVLVWLTFQEAGIVVPEILPRLGYVSKWWSPKTPQLSDIISTNMTYNVIWKVDANNNWIADEEELAPAWWGWGGWWGGWGWWWGWKRMPTTDTHGSAVEEKVEDSSTEDVEIVQEKDSKSGDIEVKTPEISDSSSQKEDSPTTSNAYTQEQIEAYAFAKDNGITTTSSIEEARMNTPLTRIQMAKMLSYYAINVLWQTPDTTKKIKFKDVSSKLDKQYDNWVTLAYQLWIMWINMPKNRFRPNDEVSRAEFVTALSRMLYNIDDWVYKATRKYYQPHMAKLYNEWIITQTDPSMKEKRWYVMLMLYRSVDTINTLK